MNVRTTHRGRRVRLALAILLMLLGVSAPAYRADATTGPRLHSGLTTGTLEDWANWVLRDLAVGAGRDPESLRTPERVLFMVAWGASEGGGLANAYGRFNPLNTSLMQADLGGVRTGPNGSIVTVDYPDFDSGVEAAARTIEGRYQNRIRAALLAPNPGAGDLISVLVHPEWTSGNACWACAADGSTSPGYEVMLRTVAGNARTNWARYAAKTLSTVRQDPGVAPTTTPPASPSTPNASPTTPPRPNQLHYRNRRAKRNGARP